MSRSVFIVIPAYNEAGAIREVVSGLRQTYDRVIVVDDGSSDATSEEAREAGASVVRHMMNRGQGAALQTGIEYSLLRGAEVIVTFDADGQHRVEDVGALLGALEREDADIAVGSRFLGIGSDVPFPRGLLLRLAVVVMRFTSRVRLTDAHNGLRAIRRSAAQRIHLTLDGMAHASEIVDQIHINGLRVVEVPVVIRYSAYSRKKGQSGFAAFRIMFDYLLRRWLR
ncbi:MAG TPA: glycosyltransferase family 2 protein [Thermoanaerobaculia bacterium]